uniref:Uncharacterized protein n=1 Tax=Rhizophora mucronata TaxID=61149 RepID=A0A2P2NGR9_RHIMU
MYSKTKLFPFVRHIGFSLCASSMTESCLGGLYAENEAVMLLCKHIRLFHYLSF